MDGALAAMAVLSLLLVVATRRRLREPSLRYAPVMAIVGAVAGLLGLALSWF